MIARKALGEAAEREDNAGELSMGDKGAEVERARAEGEETAESR